MVCDLCLETKVSGSSLATSYVQRRAVGSNCLVNVLVFLKRVEVSERSLKDNLPFPLLPCESWMFVRETENRKKTQSKSKKKTTPIFRVWA